jgi:hypothetical protein
VEVGERAPAARSVIAVDVRTQLLAMCPDGREIVSALGQCWEIRSTRDGSVRETVGTTTNGTGLAADFHPSGKRLVLSDRESVTLIETESMDELASIALSEVNGVAFSACGEHVLVAAGRSGRKTRLLGLG